MQLDSTSLTSTPGPAGCCSGAVMVLFLQNRSSHRLTLNFNLPPECLRYWQLHWSTANVHSPMPSTSVLQKPELPHMVHDCNQCCQQSAASPDARSHIPMSPHMLDETNRPPPAPISASFTCPGVPPTAGVHCKGTQTAHCQWLYKVTWYMASKCIQHGAYKGSSSAQLMLTAGYVQQLTLACGRHDRQCHG